jgi:predicted SAM-dependent methyltransferase
MKLKELIKKLLSAIYLEDFAKDTKTKALNVVRKLVRTDQRIIKDYFSNTQIRKLHVGCGGNILAGWLNSDYLPISSRILRFDATKTFPFTNDEFDYVFSEHMIEHIDYQQGLQMLSECFRVLKPKGKLRISTPDLSFLIDLYKSDKSEIHMEFAKHYIDNYVKYAPCYEDTFVINNYMRAWDHKFIYDEKVLYDSLRRVGFINITKFNVCESQDEVLQGLENISRKPAGLIGLESLVVEGMKP